MVYWFGKEVRGQKTIDQPRFQALRPSCLFMSKLKKIGVDVRLSEDEIAEFLTKTKRKESKNTQAHFSVDVIYFLGSSARKNLCTS